MSEEEHHFTADMVAKGEAAPHGLVMQNFLQMPESMGRALLSVGVLLVAACLLISVASFGVAVYSLTSQQSQSRDDTAKVHHANLLMDRVWYWMTEDYAQQLANGGHPPKLPKRPAKQQD